MKVRRIWVIVVVAIGVFYAAAYAAANPDTELANLVICGIALLVLVLPAINLLQVGKIIKNAFGEDE